MSLTPGIHLVSRRDADECLPCLKAAASIRTDITNGLQELITACGARTRELGPAAITDQSLSWHVNLGLGEGRGFALSHDPLPGVAPRRAERLHTNVVGFEGSDGGALIKLTQPFAQRQGSLKVALVDSSAELAGRGIDEAVNATVQQVTLSDCAARLARDQFPYDLIVADRRDAETLAGFTSGVIGSAGFGAMWSFEKGGLTASCFVHNGKLAIPGVIRAAVDSMLLSGKERATEQLHNALLRTLDDQFTTAEAPSIAPYARVVGDTRFIEEVSCRLGEEPVGLAAVRYAQPAKARNQASHLQLVK